MQISIEDVPVEDRTILSPCGIVCLGCEKQLEESLYAARSLVNIWTGWNMGDVAAGFGITFPEVNQTIDILKKFIKNREENGPCRGCPSTCSISQCVESKGYLTCAECSKFDQGTNETCPNHDEENTNILGKPFGARSQAFEIVNKRYNCTNIDNLRRCQEIGYINFIGEMKEKVSGGWRTWQVISPENVFREFYFKNSGK